MNPPLSNHETASTRRDVRLGVLDSWQNRLPIILKRPFYNPETVLPSVRKPAVPLVPIDEWQNRLPLIFVRPFYNPDTTTYRQERRETVYIDSWQNRISAVVPPHDLHRPVDLRLRRVPRPVDGDRPCTVLMISSSDHTNGATHQTLNVYLSKNGGFPMLITPAVTELDPYNFAGLYQLALTPGMTDTLGTFMLQVTGNSADPTDVNWQVTPSGGELTPSQIATAIWQDAVLSDFTVPGSIGYSLYTGVLPGSAGGLFIAGNNATTTVTFSGSIASVLSVVNPVTVAGETPMSGSARWTVPD